jgi:hypothetical protein
MTQVCAPIHIGMRKPRHTPVQQSEFCLQYERRPLQEAGGKKRTMMARRMAMRMVVVKKRMVFDDDGSNERGSQCCEEWICTAFHVASSFWIVWTHSPELRVA